jgi:hypothetical protein
MQSVLISFSMPVYPGALTIQVSGVGEFGGCRSVVEMS